MEKKANKLEKKLVVAIVEKESWRFVDHVKTLTNSCVIQTSFFVCLFVESIKTPKCRIPYQVQPIDNCNILSLVLFIEIS